MFHQKNTGVGSDPGRLDRPYFIRAFFEVPRPWPGREIIFHGSSGIYEVLSIYAFRKCTPFTGRGVVLTLLGGAKVGVGMSNRSIQPDPHQQFPEIIRFLAIIWAHLGTQHYLGTPPHEDTEPARAVTASRARRFGDATRPHPRPIADGLIAVPGPYSKNRGPLDLVLLHHDDADGGRFHRRAAFSCSATP